jgi:hypothetical protein
MGATRAQEYRPEVEHPARAEAALDYGLGYLVFPNAREEHTGEVTARAVARSVDLVGIAIEAPRVLVVPVMAQRT